MDCNTCAAFLEKYKEGKASFSKNREVFEHIKTCKACKESMQRLLLESDAKLFQNALLARKSKRDLAAEVLESLPEEKKGKKTRPSSGRLKPHRPTKKRDRTSSSGIIKPVRTGTKARRRRRIDDSGSFFSDELFSSDKKTGGFSMVYCESCNERIDPADLEQGLAIRHEGASYCPKCKGNIEGYEEEEAAPAATATAAPKKARRPAPARAARGGPQGKPLNLPLIGGGLIVAALILVVAVVAITTAGNSPAPEPMETKQSVKNDAGDEPAADPGQTPGDSPAVEKPADDPGPTGESDEEKAIRLHQEQEAKKAAARKALLEKVDAWIKETAAKANALVEENKYESAIEMWGGLKEKLEKEEHSEEQMAAVDEHIASAKRNWYNAAARLVAKLREQSEKLESERKYDEALKVLDQFPKEWEKIPGIDEQLRMLQSKKDMVKYRAQKYAERVARERLEKAHIALEVNKVYEPLNEKDHLLANWYGKGKISWDDKEKTLSLTTQGQSSVASYMCRYKNAAEFHDYVLEFEYKSEAGLAVFFRIKRGTNNANVNLPQMNSWKKVKLTFEGITAKIEVDGKTIEDVIDLKPGYFGFLTPRVGTAFLKNLKIKITKTEKPG